MRHVYESEAEKYYREQAEYEHAQMEQRKQEAEHCAEEGHPYYADDDGLGRCYCGGVAYPARGE